MSDSDGHRQRIAISGASGMIGQALVRRLESRFEVVQLVRRPADSTLERRWDPQAGYVEGLGLSDIDAVVNLNGAGIADRRWTTARRRELLVSRIDPTRTLAHLVATEERPQVLLSASAVGYYGDTGQRVVDERTGPGEGFLADLCLRWEAATAEAADSGVRTVLLRTGLVLDRRGGFLGKQLPLFRMGLGGPMGSGRQWLPWITLADHVGAIEHLLTSRLDGPVDLVGPNPVRQVDFAVRLGEVLHRPARVPTPVPALRLALGSDLVDEALLVSNRVEPSRLLADGFEFTHPELASALDVVLSQ